MNKIFKYNQIVCKKTDDFGKIILSSLINKSSLINIRPDLFTINAELYSGQIHEPYRCTSNYLKDGSIISNEVNDDILLMGCRSNMQLNLNNIEINECGIGGHHQLKNITSILMLMLKIAQYCDNDDNSIITMDIEFDENYSINTNKSKLKKWIIQNDSTSSQEYLTKIADEDYQFDSNISVNFIFVELPTHNSRVNTEILSDYYEDIIDYFNNTIASEKIFNPILELDSDEIKLIRDSSNNYNKFGLIHNLYLENINSKNFFKYIQQIFDFNNLHFGNIYKNVEYTPELLLSSSSIYTVSQYGYSNLIKDYIQKDHYIRSYGVKMMNMLNGTFGSRSYNIVPDFLRFTRKKYTSNTSIPNEISFNTKNNYIKINNNTLYYVKTKDTTYISFNNLFDDFNDRIRLENILIYIVKLGLFKKDELIKFIPYQRFNNKLLQNKIHIATFKLKHVDINSKDMNYKVYKTEKLTMENLLKTISIRVPININRRVNKKTLFKTSIKTFKIYKRMIDYRIFIKLFSYMYPENQKLIDFFNKI